MPVIRRVCYALAAFVLAWPLGASAQKKTIPPEGVKLVTTVHPEQGFVDDAYAFDGPGDRLAIVRADAGTYAELELIDVAGGGSAVAKLSLTPVTTEPLRVAMVAGGANIFVVGRGPAEGTVSAFLLDLEGKVVRKWGPARDIVIADVDGVEAAAVYDVKPGAKGATRYDLAFSRLDNGKVIKKRTFNADAEGYVKTLDMKILYWREGYTRLVGRKKGGYDRVKDQRMNDNEAIYDVVDGRVVSATPPSDIVEWTKIIDLRSKRNNESTFVRVAEDLHGVELLTADDRRVAVDLGAVPFSRYDSKSLQQEVARNGRIYFTLTVDPQNPEALERKANDPEIIDLYVLEQGGTKAQRLARLPRLGRPFSWHVAGGHFALLRKHKGFDRGGSDLEIYDLTAAK